MLSTDRTEICEKHYHILRYMHLLHKKVKKQAQEKWVLDQRPYVENIMSRFFPSRIRIPIVNADRVARFIAEHRQNVDQQIQHLGITS